MGRDKEWLLTLLASPFIALEALVRLAARVVIGAVRNRRTSLDQVKAETAMARALTEREKALASLRECEGLNRPERAEPEVVLEPSSEDSDSCSENERARKKAAAEEKYARANQDEERWTADESLSEEERREWQNFFGQRRREIREEIRKWI